MITIHKDDGLGTNTLFQSPVGQAVALHATLTGIFAWRQFHGIAFLNCRQQLCLAILLKSRSLFTRRLTLILQLLWEGVTPALPPLNSSPLLRSYSCKTHSHQRHHHNRSLQAHPRYRVLPPTRSGSNLTEYPSTVFELKAAVANNALTMPAPPICTWRPGPLDPTWNFERTGPVDFTSSLVFSQSCVSWRMWTAGSMQSLDHHTAKAVPPPPPPQELEPPQGCRTGCPVRGITPVGAPRHEGVRAGWSRSWLRSERVGAVQMPLWTPGWGWRLVLESWWVKRGTGWTKGVCCCYWGRGVYRILSCHNIGSLIHARSFSRQKLGLAAGTPRACSLAAEGQEAWKGYAVKPQPCHFIHREETVWAVCGGWLCEEKVSAACWGVVCGNIDISPPLEENIFSHMLTVLDSRRAGWLLRIRCRKANEGSCVSSVLCCWVFGGLSKAGSSVSSFIGMEWTWSVMSVPYGVGKCCSSWDLDLGCATSGGGLVLGKVAIWYWFIACWKV